MNEKSLNFTLQFLFYNHIFKYRIIGVNIKSTSVVKIVILPQISLQLKKKKFLISVRLYFTIYSKII
jgi:hypothetical protein